MIISRTPLRISFFGGGTDYREYYLRHPGAVLGTTINKYVYVSINQLSDFFDYKIRVGYSKAELVNSVSDIIHPSVRECLKFKKIEGNLDIHIFADLPARTGLGSSSAFTVGFLHGLHALEGKIISKHQLGERARYVEQELIKENVGSQDQFHAAFGGFNIIEFSGKGVKVRPLIISKEKRELLGEALMLFYTGLVRHASEVVQEQVDNTRSCSKDDYLQKMYKMVFDAEELVSNSKSDFFIKDMGELFHESWQLKKQLSSKVSNPLIDEIYNCARAAGAYGGKLCGAGNGGFIALLVDPSSQARVRESLKQLLEVECALEDQGSSIIYLN